jgi:tetratricopeptide (TPR) repeat protein
MMLSFLGRGEEAIERRKRAQRLDPLSPIISPAMDFYLAGRYDEAIDETLEQLELFPEFWNSNLILGFAYGQLSRFDEAIRALEAARAANQDSTWVLGSLGYAKAISGDRDGALEILKEVLRRSKQNYVSAYDVACIYKGLGQTEKTYEWLEKAYQERSFFLLMVKVDPVFESLRSDPRFQDLLRRMNFPE